MGSMICYYCKKEKSRSDFSMIGDYSGCFDCNERFQELKQQEIDKRLLEVVKKVLE